MADICRITLPSGQAFDLKDEGAYRKPAPGIPASDLAEGIALPAVTASDNGKVLRVVSGAWAAAAIPAASGVSF